MAKTSKVRRGVIIKTKEEKQQRRREYYLKNREKIKQRVKDWAAIYSHRSDGYIVNIQKDDLIEMALNTPKCQICDKPILYWKPGHFGSNRDSATLDRVNNGKEMRKDNIMILCGQCNLAKNTWTILDFQKYCRMVAEKDFSQYG